MNTTTRIGALLLVALVLLLVGCAPASRIVRQGEGDSPQTLDLRTPEEGALRARVQHLVVPDGPGSWVREAAWDEYGLTLSNSSSSPVVVQAIEVSSEHFTSAHQLDRGELEAISSKHFERMKTLGIVLMIGSAALTTAASVAFVAAGWTLATPAIPLLLAFEGVSAYRTMVRRAEDRGVMDYQLARRGIHLPATIAPGSELTASAFVPVTPAPQRLAVRYLLEGEVRNAVVELAPLANLHLAPRKEIPEGGKS